MTTTTREFIRSKPKPTEVEALEFARSVMESQGVYYLWDMLSLESAREALEKNAFDASEVMALEKIIYAMET